MKVLAILLALFLICGLASCDTMNKTKTETPISKETENHDKQSTIFEEHQPFSVTKSENGYIYRIYNNNLLVEEDYSAREPVWHYITDSLIYVTVQTGTGKSTNWAFFYDYASNKRSKTFKWILDYTESKVVMGYPDKAVVQSIFSDEYYFEITDFEHPLAGVADSILSANFSEDMKTVTVTYVVDGSHDTVTQTFPLT